MTVVSSSIFLAFSIAKATVIFPSKGDIVCIGDDSLSTYRENTHCYTID